MTKTRSHESYRINKKEKSVDAQNHYPFVRGGIRTLKLNMHSPQGQS